MSKREPRNIDEALYEELNQFKRNEIWNLVPRLAKWVF